jgi:hypothetical protein
MILRKSSAFSSVSRLVSSFFAVLCFILCLGLWAGPALAALLQYDIILDRSGTYNFPSATVGYNPAPPGLSVAVTNTGIRSTGDLFVEISNPSYFVSTKTQLGDLSANETVGFTVSPQKGLNLGTYTATVTVSGSNVAQESFNVSFTVNPATPTYAIALDRTGTYNFPAETLNYASAPTSLYVTVTNTGNQATGSLNVTLSNTDFTTSKAVLNNIGVNGTDSFTVTPIMGLSAGPHTATVTVSGSNGIEEEFNVSFEVNPATVTYAIALDRTGTYNFPAEMDGYASAPTSLIVTVTNTGNQAIGSLNVVLSNTDFTTSKVVLSDIGVNGTDSFTVTPIMGLSAGPHTATVTVSGSNGITQSFNVSFTVNPATATYAIALDRTGTYNFPAAPYNYASAPTSLIVTVTNAGNQATGALSVVLSNTGFTTSKTVLSDIGVNGTDSFTVTPKTGLGTGSHTATVTVRGSNGISQSFNVSFTVNPAAATYAIALDRTGIYNFPAATDGYVSAPTSLIVTVTNTGNQATGDLNVALSNTDFTPSKAVLSDIGVNGTDSFTVTPIKGLCTGPHTATVTVSGNNVITQNFDVSFTVNLPTTSTYKIGLSVGSTYYFPSAAVGYDSQTALNVTVTNTGNGATGDLNVALYGANSDSFVNSTGSLASIAVGDTRSFSVAPKRSLPRGTYTATVTVSGAHDISQSFNVSFTVTSGGDGHGAVAGGESMGCNAFFSPLFALGLFLAVKGLKKVVAR